MWQDTFFCAHAVSRKNFFCKIFPFFWKQKFLIRSGYVKKGVGGHCQINTMPRRIKYHSINHSLNCLSGSKRVVIFHKAFATGWLDAWKSPSRLSRFIKINDQTQTGKGSTSKASWNAFSHLHFVVFISRDPAVRFGWFQVCAQAFFSFAVAFKTGPKRGKKVFPRVVENHNIHALLWSLVSCCYITWYHANFPKFTLTHLEYLSQQRWWNWQNFAVVTCIVDNAVRKWCVSMKNVQTRNSLPNCASCRIFVWRTWLFSMFQRRARLKFGAEQPLLVQF